MMKLDEIEVDILFKLVQKELVNVEERGSVKDKQHEFDLRQLYHKLAAKRVKDDV